MMNDEYLKEFQGRMATLDGYNANIVDLVFLFTGRTSQGTVQQGVGGCN